MKDIIGKIIIIAIFIGALYGVYTVLPEYPHNFIKSTIQSSVDDEAKMRVAQVKALTNKDVDNKTYEEIFAAHTNTGCWVYIPLDKSDDGLEHVYYYGKDAAVNLKDYPDYGGMMYNGSIIKVDFKITNGSVDIVPYIDDLTKPLQIFDAKHVKQNADVKADFFQQLYKGMKGED